MRALGKKGIGLLLAGALGAVLAGAWVRSMQDPGASPLAAARPTQPAAREAPALEGPPADLEFREPHASDVALPSGALAPREPVASPLAGGEGEAQATELPAAPRPLPADLANPYGSKYAGLFPDELEAAQKDLRRKQFELARPLFDERFELGQYRVIGPMKGRSFPGLGPAEPHPLATRPLVLMRSASVGEGYQEFHLVEVHPHELPELQALRDEEVWLQARIDELEAEW